MKAEATTEKSSTLFDAAVLSVAKSLGNDPEEDLVALESLPPALAKRVAWKWERIPYPTFCAFRASMADEDEPQQKRTRTSDDKTGLRGNDVDDWSVHAHTAPFPWSPLLSH